MASTDSHPMGNYEPPLDDEELPFNYMDLDPEPNQIDLVVSCIRGELRGIVSLEAGGIIAYALGDDYASLIVDALIAQRQAAKTDG